jgi:hypothetical protein
MDFAHFFAVLMRVCAIIASIVIGAVNILVFVFGLTDWPSGFYPAVLHSLLL